MKSYWEIPGPSKAPSSHCIAFYKYDGSNIRSEWSRKTGWSKFGSRNCLLDKDHPFLGDAIEIFRQTYAEPLTKLFKESKYFRGIEGATAFCEFFGPKSFAGVHFPDDPKELVLFDLNILKKGFMLPRDFARILGDAGIKIAQVIYEGNFGVQFIRDVMDGKYPVYEGVVAKGVIEGKKKNPQHGLWMAKVKTRMWLDELRTKASSDPEFRKILEDNRLEQDGF